MKGSMRGIVDGDVWVDKFGYLHDVKEMPNDYIENCVAFLERRAQSFRNVLKKSPCLELQYAVETMEESVESFVEELNRRTREGIVIDREITQSDITAMEDAGYERTH